MRLTAANTAIVLDSTADFPEAPERFPNWRVVPLYVRFGDESFRDYVELGPERFYERLRTAPELPTTSQPTPGDFLAVYEELGSFERVYSLHISSTLSGTFQSAQTAASQVGDKVRTVDSETASAAVAMLGLAIQRRLERGTDDEEIEALVARFRDAAGLLFTVDTLEFLQRGGRIGRAAKFAGQLLNVKPILTIEGGEVVPLKRVRGSAKAFAEFQSAFTAATSDAAGLRVGIAHAEAPERAEQLVKMVRGERPQATIEVVTTLGAVVGTHAGPGTVGFFWFDDRETANAVSR
jgi:DegV family protein with EDD domain